MAKQAINKNKSDLTGKKAAGQKPAAKKADPKKAAKKATPKEQKGRKAVVPDLMQGISPNR